MDPGDVNVFIQERKLYVRCHNTWKEISKANGISLDPPDQFGKFYSNVSLSLKDFVANNLVALIFDLEFKAEIQGSK